MKVRLHRSKTATASAVLLSTFAMSLVGCDWSGYGPTLVGSGVAITEDRVLDSFTKIDVSGALKVDAKIGEPSSVTVTGDDNVVALISSKVTDGTLHLHLEHNGRVQEKTPLLITVVGEIIGKVDVSGACHVTINGVTGSDLDIGISGASELKLDGQCDQLQAEVSGASTLKASRLESTRAIVDVSGASTATVNASESIIGSASGASSIRYSGNPDKANVNTSGASSANAVD